MKLSKDKITLPGRKQVYRFKSKDGCFKKDVITLYDEGSEGTPLLMKVMDKGKLTYRLPTLQEICKTAHENISSLPEKYKVLTDAPTYPVELSQKLQCLTEALKLQITKNEINYTTA